MDIIFFIDILFLGVLFLIYFDLVVFLDENLVEVVCGVS